MAKILFEIMTPLDVLVVVTEDYWNVITSIKHPVMKDKEDEVRLVLSDPDEIRQSIKDENVYLFYRIQKQKRWICAVVKDNTGKGFLITAYPTDNIKEGKVIWKK